MTAYCLFLSVLLLVLHRVLCDKAMGTTLIDSVLVQIAGALTMTTCWHSPIRTSIHKREMWANAQRDGRPAEHRWRPLFNTAKLG